MRAALALLVVGSLALVVQGGIATFLPPPYCPDIALLVVISIGFVWESTSGGMAVAALLGYAADLLSGSLFGQHALLRLFAYVAARVASRRVNIRGVLPVACFAAVGTLVYGLGLLAVTAFYTGSAGPSWGWFADLLRHSLANAVVAPVVLLFVQRVLALVEDNEGGRRNLRFDPSEGPV